MYCTGRSVSGRPSPYARPETIDETAALITQAGGQAVPVRVDHTSEVEVEALVARIIKEQGRLDVLVNSIAGEDPLMGQYGSLSDTLGAGGNPLSWSVKLGIKGLALNMASQLREHRVTAVAVTPGFPRSEAMLEYFGVTEENWQDAGATDSNFLQSESPLFVGREVAALALDRRMLERTGQLWSSWELCRDYGFTDADGRRPDWGGQENLDFSMFPPSFLDMYRTGLALQRDWLNRLAARTERALRQLPAAPVAPADPGTARATTRRRRPVAPAKAGARPKR